MTRELIACSLNCHVVGILPIYSALHDAETNEAAAKARWLRQLPHVKPATRSKVRCFARVLTRRNLDPIGLGDFKDDFELTGDPVEDVKRWLPFTHYPLKRKLEILAAAESLKIKPLCRKDYKVRAFVKRETYGQFKYARWINSRSDRFKAFCGPFFHLVERRVFGGKLSKYFIKDVPVADRPRVIKERLYVPGCYYAATDYKSFEGSFDAQTIESIECQLYSYMAGTKYKFIYEQILKALCGVQRCRMKSVSARGHARMSGDMCTSLGNGFTNLILMLFAAKEHGWNWKNMDAVFEGDDGLVRVERKDELPTEDYFSTLGFTMKMKISEDVGEAGFCQNYFDVNDAEPTNIVDPLKHLARLGWTHSAAMHGGPRVRKQLAKAKAFSLLYSCPSNPVLASMAKWVLRSTDDVDARWGEGWWDCQLRASFRELRDVRVTEQSRVLVSKLFGLPVSAQIEIEEFFDRLPPVLKPIDHPTIFRYCAARNPHWVLNWHLSKVTKMAGDPW